MSLLKWLSGPKTRGSIAADFIGEEGGESQLKRKRSIGKNSEPSAVVSTNADEVHRVGGDNASKTKVRKLNDRWLEEFFF